MKVDLDEDEFMRERLLGHHYREFTFGQILAAKAAKNGEKVFLNYMPDGRSFSYREIDMLSNRIANGLLKTGVGRGAHVAMLMGNSPEQILVYFALAKIGAISVPINTAARGQFLEYYLKNSDSVAVIVDEELYPAFAKVASGSDVRAVFVLEAAGGGDLPAGARSFSALMDASEEAPVIEVAYNDPCCLMYTSGTTGPSKGNIFPQIHTLTFGADQIEATELTSNDTYYVWMPLFHIGAYGGMVLAALLADASVALVRTLSVSRFWDDIRQSGATATMILSIGDFLFRQPPGPDDKNHSLRFAVTTPVPHDVVALEERFGFKMMQGFGLSDYCLAFTQTLHEPADKRMSIGRPMRDVQARIVDDEGMDVPTGETGEIVLRKDGLPFATSQGYYKMPDSTLESRPNLWFHTGDLGSRDEDGYFYFVGRKKDAIRRRGENISAYEVETIIGKHDAVAEVAVYALKMEGSDDEVVATVVLKDGYELTEIALIDHCQGEMPHFMIPRFVEFRTELPRTTTQKIMKFRLREEVELNRHKIWDREREGVAIAR